MGCLKGICISEQRGTQKSEIDYAILKEDWGIEKDAHAGHWHRQVSLLSYEMIEEFRNKGADVDFGSFGENLIVDGFGSLKTIPVGSRFQIGDVILELTQIGKECHTHCKIYQAMGDCIMPREGVFTKVIRGGEICKGDEVTLLPPALDRKMTAAVITLSDSGARGERVDESGPLLCEQLKKAGYDVVEKLLLPDEEARIKAELIRLCDQRQIQLIMTTGGTGFSPRDCTPEATIAVATRNVPGIAEAIRAGSMKYTKRAMLSRGVSVIRNKTLIVNLPGSPKAVKEGTDLILDTLAHGIRVLIGMESNCAQNS